jgi:flagellar export protein FliJ
MNKIIVWKKLEEQKQKQRDTIKSEYQSALSSIQKLESHLQRLISLKGEYINREIEISKNEHFSSQIHVTRGTIQQIQLLQNKAESEIEFLQSKLNKIHNELQSSIIECIKFEKLRMNAEKEYDMRLNKKLNKESENTALQSYCYKSL